MLVADRFRRKLPLAVLVALTAMAMSVLAVAPALAKSTREYTGVSFGKDGTSGTTFEHAGAVAVDQSSRDVYVADYGTGSVYKFNDKHEPGEFSALAGAHAITGFSFDPGEPNVDQIAVNSSTHDLYVVDYGNKALKAFKANGEPAEFSALHSSEIGGFEELCGVAVDQNGDIYAGDFLTGVHVYSPSGEELASLSTSVPCNLAVDSHGDVYVNHWKSSVEKFTPSAFPVTLTTTYSSAGTVDAGSAFGVAVDPANDDVLVDENTKIAEHDEHGALLATFGAGGAGALSASEGLAVDATSGEVYVSDSGGEQRVGIWGPLVALIEHALTVTKAGPGQGIVTSSPAGIECGSTCAGEFQEHSTVTLTATPAANSAFTGWSGPGAGSCTTAPTCEVAIGTVDSAVTATFGKPEWGIELSHQNGYGAAGVVDPFSGSGTSFDKESGSNEYKIVVKNTGSAATSGLVSVADQLPDGLAINSDSVEHEVYGQGWSCSVVSGGGSVTCTRSDALEPGQAYPPIQIYIYAGPNAVDPAVDLASVGGGDVAELATATDPTAIAPAVPFGIQTFTTSVADSSGHPFVQAAGHPFSASTAIVFNSTFDAGGTNRGEPLGETFIAGGEAREVQTELPPGFIGNPQVAPTCPPEMFVHECPHRSIVGFAELSFNGHAATGPEFGFNSPSFVYSTAPPPGKAAAFLFEHFGAPFVLYAQVRSDGDYGVTIGDNASGLPGPMAIDLTLCENGVREEDNRPKHECAPASAESGALLTTPAKCSAPSTTLRADSWEHQEPYVEKTAFTGLHLINGEPSQSESFVTGCDSPELASLWGESSIGLAPETTQADAPAGIGFGLATPQNGEAGKLATPELKDSTIVLPQGMSVSPAAAAGLEGCSDAQIALHSGKPGDCPDASQVGSVEVLTPLLSASPNVEGIPEKGEKLFCSEGDWNGASSFAYQWLSDGAPIAGATSREYTAQAADEGKPVQCQVTAANAGGSSTAVSHPVVILEFFENEEEEESREPGSPVPQSRLGAPVGVASPGRALSCGTVTWKEEPVFAYAWLRDGVPIAGAQASEYTLSAEDAGKAIQCQITASNADGSVIADSEAVVVSPGSSTAPPLLGAPVRGKVFLGTPLCSPCSAQDAQEGRVFRLFIEAGDPERGVIVKLAGSVSADPSTGRLTASFKNNPQLPFEDLRLTFKNGPRAPLATPQACGSATTTSDLTSWSSQPGTQEAHGTPDAFPSSSFSVDWDGHGGACPASVPFAPGFLAQASSGTAGAFTPFTVSLTREDREQDLAGVAVSLPNGLLGMLSKVVQCGEPQAAQGSCGDASRIGTATVGAGPGADPFYLSGPVFLTGPYKGAPFGLSVAVPVVAGPFDLGTVVVRAAVLVNPVTAAVSVVSDPLPQIVDGVPVRLRDVRVTVDREGFLFNPTNCSARQVSATIGGEHVNAGEANKSVSVSSPFAVSGCAGLAFSPSFSASTQGSTSKADGASLVVRVASTAGQANIAKVDVQLPKALPARLTTLQQACTEAQFDANPAGCPAASVIGMARAVSPVLNSPLSGPAYLVSHGGAAFPDVMFVLQGEGVLIDLDGATDIKNGITFSRFENVPDAPISSFETVFPEGPHSVLAADIPVSAKHSLCGQSLTMPTTITAQNGKQVVQQTHVAVTGCAKTKVKPLTRAQKLARALKACRTKYGKAKHKRIACEKQARKKYGVVKVKKASKTDRRGK